MESLDECTSMHFSQKLSWICLKLPTENKAHFRKAHSHICENKSFGKQESLINPWDMFKIHQSHWICLKSKAKLCSVPHKYTLKLSVGCLPCVDILWVVNWFYWTFLLIKLPKIGLVHDFTASILVEASLSHTLCGHLTGLSVPSPARPLTLLFLVQKPLVAVN